MRKKTRKRIARLHEALRVARESIVQQMDEARLEEQQFSKLSNQLGDAKRETAETNAAYMAATRELTKCRAELTRCRAELARNDPTNPSVAVRFKALETEIHSVREAHRRAREAADDNGLRLRFAQHDMREVARQLDEVHAQLALARAWGFECIESMAAEMESEIAALEGSFGVYNRTIDDTRAQLALACAWGRECIDSMAAELIDGREHARTLVELADSRQDQLLDELGRRERAERALTAERAACKRHSDEAHRWKMVAEHEQERCRSLVENQRQDRQSIDGLRSEVKQALRAGGSDPRIAQLEAKIAQLEARASYDVGRNKLLTNAISRMARVVAPAIRFVQVRADDGASGVERCGPLGQLVAAVGRYVKETSKSKRPAPFDIGKLIDAARKASIGPWTAHDEFKTKGERVMTVLSSGDFVASTSGLFVTRQATVYNAEYIAAAGPDVVVDLVQRLQAAEEIAVVLAVSETEPGTEPEPEPLAGVEVALISADGASIVRTAPFDIGDSSEEGDGAE